VSSLGFEISTGLLCLCDVACCELLLKEAINNGSVGKVMTRYMLLTSIVEVVEVIQNSLFCVISTLRLTVEIVSEYFRLKIGL